MNARWTAPHRATVAAGGGILRKSIGVAVVLAGFWPLRAATHAPWSGFHFSSGDSAHSSPRTFAEQQTSRAIAPGVWHHQTTAVAGPWVINVIEIDRRQPHLHFETVKARGRLHGLEKTSVMAAAVDGERHRVVAAINGDFFDATGVPINLQVCRGELLRGEAPHSVFALTADGSPLLEVFTASYQVRTADGVWRSLHGFNRRRQSDEAILYTGVFGPTTATNDYGSEVRLELLSALTNNDTLGAVVRERHTSAGNSPLAGSVVVISAHGAARQWLDEDIAIGDTLLLLYALNPLPERARIVEAIGGLPRLVRNGSVSVETELEGGAKFANVRHPRTAVGFSADSSRIFLVTVDGRQPHSVGMTLYELADLMTSLGCAQALNLDGGGSTTMVVRGRVVNRPSDATGERPVGNALLLISRAPTGPVAELAIAPRLAVCPAGESMDFAAAAVDSFFNPLALGNQLFSWQLSARRLGRVDANGKFTAAGRRGLPGQGGAAAPPEDSGYVILAHKTGLRDSAKVVVTSWRALHVAPDSLVLSVGEARALQATLVDSRGNRYKKLPGQLRWGVEGKMGKISSNGVFTATVDGSGRLRAQFRNLATSVPVVVRPKPLDISPNDRR